MAATPLGHKPYAYGLRPDTDPHGRARWWRHPMTGRFISSRSAAQINALAYRSNLKTDMMKAIPGLTSRDADRVVRAVGTKKLRGEGFGYRARRRNAILAKLRELGYAIPRKLLREIIRWGDTP